MNVTIAVILVLQLVTVVSVWQIIQKYKKEIQNQQIIDKVKESVELVKGRSSRAILASNCKLR